MILRPAESPLSVNKMFCNSTETSSQSLLSCGDGGRRLFVQNDQMRPRKMLREMICVLHNGYEMASLLFNTVVPN